MTLWRIKDGIPSIADALLATGGLIGVCLLFIPCIEPLLDFFDPKGLSYLGFLFGLIIMLGVGAVAVWVFIRNEKKMRWEVVIPRRVFAFTAAPLIFIAMHLTSFWTRDADISFFEHIGLLVILFVPVFGVIVRLSLLFPAKAAAIALWFQLGLTGLGVLAKVAYLFLKK